jgi:hypothetical protein
MFSHRLDVVTGERVVRDGYAYCDLLLTTAAADHRAQAVR